MQDMNIKAQTEGIQTKASRRMKQEETQKKKKNHTAVKALHCTLHLWILYLKLKIKALSKF